MVKIVKHVAALAQSLKVFVGVVRRFVVEMGRRQDDHGGAAARMVGWLGISNRATLSVTPGGRRRIKPATILKTADFSAVRASARPAMANPVRARNGKPDAGADL